MAIITNIDKLRISEIEEKIANDMVLTVDATGLVAWKNQTDITPDMSAYYTKDEIDALLENISYNDLLNAPTNLSDFNNDEGFITISDVPSYTGGDGIDITNNEIRIKQSVLDEINANTNKTLSDVTSEGNVTNTKIKGSEVFSNTMKEDYAQIKNVNDSGWGLLPLQSEMKIALTAKDGTTVLSSIDVSWLASGDLAVSIDDTDPENPELVFSQGGVEVARIPASTLLSGVVRGGDLSGYKLQFKDGDNTVLFDIDLENLFDQHYTKNEADGRFALRTRSITGTGSLTGGGNLTANRTIDLSSTTKSDIAKGVDANIWTSDKDNYVGIHKPMFNNNLDEEFTGKTRWIVGRPIENGTPIASNGRGFVLGHQQNKADEYGTEVIFSGSEDFVFRNKNNGVVYPWLRVWHSGNLEDPATETWVNNQGFLKTAQAPLTNSTTNTISGTQVRRAALTGDVTANQNSNETTLKQTIKDDIAKGVTAHGWGNHADEGYATEDYVDTAIQAIPPTDLSDYITEAESDQKYLQSSDLSPYMKTADAEEAFAPATGYPDWALQLTDLLNF